MYALISRDKIHLPAGAVLRMPGTWQDYCALRDSRGDGSVPRIKYRNGEILLMSPLPRHGREANILADVVKALLDRENRNYEAFTPITMEIPESGGIEPDYARMLRPFRGFRLSPQSCDRLVVDVLIKQILANRYGYLN